jgi:hypothetical protein
MASLRSIATSLCVIALALAAIAKGVDILRFEALDAAVQASLQQPAAKDPAALKAQRRQIFATMASLRPWTSTSGLSVKAHEDVLFLSKAADVDKPIEANLIELLTVNPTAGASWLDLAVLLRSRDAPMPQILKTLQMSSLTFPREQETRTERTLFCLELWQSLPADEQRRALNQLAELKGRLDDAELQQFREELEAKPEAIKANLVRELAARGAADPSWLQALGLKP